MDAPLGKQLRRRAVPGRSTPLPAQKWADLGRRVPGQVGHRALGNNVPAARTGLIQHVQNARGAVAHGAGQLHPLALTGGKR